MKWAALILALPSAVLGPVESPPCSRQRLRPDSGGFAQGLPARVLAPQIFFARMSVLHRVMSTKDFACHARVCTGFLALNELGFAMSIALGPKYLEHMVHQKLDDQVRQKIRWIETHRNSSSN